MGLYHSTYKAYGLEIPADTDIDDIDRACFGQADSPDSVGYIVVGDRDQLLLVTRHTPVKENQVVAFTAEFFNQPDTASWIVAIHEAAVRLGYADHPAPAWRVIHNYR